jgi:hypothetical protein
MNNILLRATGADFLYNVSHGYFDDSDGRLDIALGLEIADADNEEAPPEILVRLANLELPAKTGTLNVRDHHDAWDGDDGKPHAYVYSGFHHPNVTASVGVVSHGDGQLTADIKVVTDDVRYYDERARDNSMAGKCVLSRQPRDEMWGP